ncbi:MAG TPA: hypothetical protein VJ608_04825 [Albitalea sp.]|nr:hypothetical protein [Albitalea sp.]
MTMTTALPIFPDALAEVRRHAQRTGLVLVHATPRLGRYDDPEDSWDLLQHGVKVAEVTWDVTRLTGGWMPAVWAYGPAYLAERETPGRKGSDVIRSDDSWSWTHRTWGFSRKAEAVSVARRRALTALDAAITRMETGQWPAGVP